jgi:DNA-binding transcriptional MerR regulator
VRRRRVRRWGCDDVKLKELCEVSGCPAPTVKYYLREGLLHAGAHVNARSADYDASHVERLRLLRALREVGNLSIVAVGKVIDAIEGPSHDVHDVLGSAVHALGPPPVETAAGYAAERLEVLAYLEHLDWMVAPDAPAVDLLASILARVREFWGAGASVRIFDRYAHAIDQLAVGDLDVIGEIDDLESTIRRMVVGTVLWDNAIVALRRLAAENQSRRRYPSANASASGLNRRTTGR